MDQKMGSCCCKMSVLGCICQDRLLIRECHICAGDVAIAVRCVSVAISGIIKKLFRFALLCLDPETWTV